MAKTPSWVKAFHRNKKWFKAASATLEAFYQAREGGPFSRGLALFASAGSVVETLYPSESGWYKIRSLDLQETDYSVGGFLCDMLMQSKVPRELISVTLSSQVWAWMGPDGRPFAAAMYSGNQFNEGPYILRGKDDDFLELVREAVWSQGSELMLAVTRDKGMNTWRSAGRFRLEALTPLGEYIGPKPPEFYADRISKYPAGPRTVMFAGPTGVGKSVLARHISNRLGKGGARTLKISSEVLKSVGFEELLGMVRTIQPTVLLLDDLDLRSETNTARFLAMLEALRDPNCLVIVTVMTQPKWQPEDMKPGSWHFPGMRPNRIDEIFVLWLPTDKERAEVLNLYYDIFGVKLGKGLLKKVVKKTEGLSGAYLMEVARRISVHGTKTWKAEVDSVLMMAPRPRTDDEEEEGEEKTPDSPKKSKKNGTPDVVAR